MKITGYEALCNLGNNIDDIYKKAIKGDNTCFDIVNNYTKNPVRIGTIKEDLPEIKNIYFNTRCNQLILKNIDLLKKNISCLVEKYSAKRIGIVVATTNTGVQEFEKSGLKEHCELGNPALFLKEYLNLENFYTTVSTACSSGIKAFIVARDIIENKVSDAVILCCIDSIASVPVYGFSSLGVLSLQESKPFDKNRTGMNIGEACSVFILENDNHSGIKIMGIGESSDIYHSTTPDPEAEESVFAIKKALDDAGVNALDIDYINAHGTGTIANEIMEAKAIYEVFKDNVPVSSTKPLTGHCLGAAAGIETALCCKLLDSFNNKLYPHIYNEFDDSLPKINIVKKDDIYNKCNICMCNSFGFGGVNAIMILGKEDE